MTFVEKIQHALETTHQQGLLDESMTPEILAPLAEAIAPIITGYLAQNNGDFPDQAALCTIAHNFNQDGPLVSGLISRNTPEAIAYWQQLEQQLQQKTRLQWPDIGSFYQEEITSQTLQRVHRHLSKFQFQARFSTWVYTIWKREYLRLKDKIEAEQTQEISLQQELNESRSLGETLPADEADPAEAAEKSQLIASFQLRLESVAQSLDVQIFRLHSEGYKLAEIKAILEKSEERVPSVATIKRRKDRMLQTLQSDPEIRAIADELGLLQK